MINQQQILDGIRTIEKGNCPDKDISDILISHRCMQWLKMAYPHHINSARSFINQITLKERFKTCEPIFQGLKNYPYAVIKGAALSQEAYGDANLRQSCDIDLLISRTYLDDIKKLLLQHGFVQDHITQAGLQPLSRKELIFQSAMSHQTVPFVKEIHNPLVPYVNVDINFDIFWGESNRKIDMDDFLKHTQETTLYGVSVQILQPIYAFISLCLHHYKDMNSLFLLSDRGMHIDQFCDILYFLKSKAPNVESLIEAAQLYNVTEYLHYCVYYTNRLCPTPILNSYLKALEKVTPIDLTDFFGLIPSEQKKWTIPFEERLFDPAFRQRFYNSLAKPQQEKVRLNRQYMM